MKSKCHIFYTRNLKERDKQRPPNTQNYAINYNNAWDQCLPNPSVSVQ